MRCWPAPGSATHSRRSAASTSATMRRRCDRSALGSVPDRPAPPSGCSTAPRATAPERSSRTGSRCSPTSTTTVRSMSRGSSATRPASRSIDDWDGFGQRTTASGTVRLDQVLVPWDLITPYHLTFERPQTFGAFAQLLHAAIDVGIARAALADAAEFVTHQEPSLPGRRGRTRGRGSAGRARVRRDRAPGPRAPRHCSARPARSVDQANDDLTESKAARASLAVAAARAAATTASVDAGSRLFEVCWHPVRARLARPRPALAQRPHPHAPRPCRVEGPAPRSLRDRRQPSRATDSSDAAG